LKGKHRRGRFVGCLAGTNFLRAGVHKACHSSLGKKKKEKKGAHRRAVRRYPLFSGAHYGWTSSPRGASKADYYRGLYLRGAGLGDEIPAFELIRATTAGKTESERAERKFSSAKLRPRNLFPLDGRWKSKSADGRFLHGWAAGSTGDLRNAPYGKLFRICRCARYSDEGFRGSGCARPPPCRFSVISATRVELTQAHSLEPAARSLPEKHEPFIDQRPFPRAACIRE